MRTTRTVAAATVAVLALTGLTACSTAQKAGNEAAHAAAGLPADALAALGLANTHLQSENSAKITGTVQQPGQAAPEHMSGAMAWGSGARFTGTMAGAPGMSQFSSDGTVPFLMTGGAMYMKLTNPTTVSQLGGKQWMKLDFAEIAALSKNAQASSLGAGMDNMLKQMSPVQTVRAVSADKGVHSLGAETMDGQQTTHYTGHLTLDQILAAMPGLTASQRATLGAADTKIGLTGEDVDIWLNDQALPVRVREHATTGKGAMDIDRHFSDYGVPVSVTVPSAADTLDLAAMLKKAEAAAKS
ncbi:hypothetical protein ABH931_003872 [Streptacidiphilus sp. MAP12-33]|uniref:hypothetical protein n=1 Tax=Streptacidiphilus sp. MAP12-33 TaxID=3156266 RepID=UPI0035136BFC